MRKILGAGAVVTVILGSTSVGSAAAPAADPIGSKGSFYISAERVFGLQVHSESSEATVGTVTTKVTESHTDFGLLIGNPRQGVWNIPQLGFDFNVIDGLTIGGAIGFWLGSRKDKTESGGATVENDGPSFNAFKISPRVGYIIGLSEQAAVWLRGGFSFFTYGTSSERTTGGGVTTKSTDSANGVGINLEPGFLFMVNPYFGFNGFINVDIPVSGKAKSDSTTGGTTKSTETDLKQMNFGLTLGITGRI